MAVSLLRTLLIDEVRVVEGVRLHTNFVAVDEAANVGVGEAQLLGLQQRLCGQSLEAVAGHADTMVHDALQAAQEPAINLGLGVEPARKGLY